MRAWQSTFLISIVVLLLAASWAFGFSSLLTIVGFITVSVAVINGLISGPRPSGHNPVLSILKNLLNVSGFLKVATVAIYLSALCLAVYGGFTRYSEYRELQKVSIEGLVLLANGDPADKATVSLFLTQGPLQTVASNGRFTFSKIDLSSEPSRRIKFEARLGSREGSAEVDLTAAPPKTLVINLSAGDPPFRVTYFLLERQAIDFLLQGKVDKNWEEKLAGQPFIVPNRVYRSLSVFVRNFSKTVGTESPTYTFYKEENGVRSDSQSLPTGDSPINTLFVATSEGEVVYLDSEVPAFLNNLLDHNQQWRLFINPGTNQPLPYPLVFRKYVDRTDLALLSQASVGKFYSFITREYMPPDFGYLEMYLSGICGDEPPWYTYAKYVGRLLRLRVALVENITNEPIKLGRFTFKENDSEGLRSQDLNKSQIEKSRVVQDRLFPMEMLKPGEKIVIPLEMDFGIDKDDTKTGLVTVASRPDVVGQLSNMGQIFFSAAQTAAPGQGASIPAYLLEDMLRRSDQMVTLDEEYLLGPSVTIDKLEVDRVEFPFRQFDPTKIVIFNQTDSGSCPYIYTYSEQTRTWRNEGVILRARIGQQKESLDEKVLSQFSTRVRIVEQEREDSFIDLVYLRVTYDNGAEATFYPRNEHLRALDGNRVTLKKGEELPLVFEIPNNRRIRKAVLGAVGYYTPYMNSVKTVSQQLKTR